jgi:hypothetical protein
MLPLVVLALFVAGIALIYTKQDLLVQRAIAGLNEQFKGTLVLEDSHVSVFTNFPYISIDLQGIKFYGENATSALPIYEVDDLYVGFSIADILAGNFKVKAVKVLSGHIRLETYEDGTINLLQAKNVTSSEDSGETEGFEFELKKLFIENLHVSLAKPEKDELLQVHLKELQTSVKSKQGVLDVLLQVSLHMLMEKEGNSAFFSDKHMVLELGFEFNQDTQMLTLSPSTLQLEDVFLSVRGKAILEELGIRLDLDLDGEKQDFDLIAAFLPKETGEAFKRYENQGEVFFRGSIRGLVAPGESPAVAFEFGCDNAFFENKALERRVEDLRFSAFFTNGQERNLKTSEFRLQNFNARPDRGVFQGNLTVRNFENPYVKVDLLADLDLAFIGEFFQIPDLKGVSGQVQLKMDFDELVDLNFSNASIRQVKESLDSELTIRNLNLTYADFPYPIQNLNAYAKMDDGALTITHFSFRLAESDVALKAKVSNLPAIFHRLDIPVNIQLEINSELLQIGKLIQQGQEQSEEISQFGLAMDLQANAVDLFKFDYLPKGKLQLKKLDFALKNYPHAFKRFRGIFEIDSQMVAIRSFQGKVDTSDIYLSGKLDNYPKWFGKNPTGTSQLKVQFASDYLKIKDLMTYQGVNFLPDSYKEEYFTGLRFDAALTMEKGGGKQHYFLDIHKLQAQTKLHPLKFEAFSGRLSWVDQYLKIENFGGTMGASSFRISMGYNLGDSLLQPIDSRPDYFQLKGQTLDLDALMGYESMEKESNHAEAFNIFKLPFRDFKLGLTVEKVLYHGSWLENIQAKFRSSKDSMLYIDQLDFAIADGKFRMNGYLNGRNPDKIYFHSKIRVDQIQVDQLLFKMDNMGKDVVLADNLKGKVSGSIESKLLVYPDFTPILDQSEAKINVSIYHGELIDFAPMRAMGSFFADRNMNRVRFDTLQNNFELKKGVLTIPSMQINSSLGFMELSGQQALDMKMDYLVRVPWSLVTQVGARALFGGRNRDEVDPEQEDAIISRDANRRVRFLNIRMSGTPDDLDVGLARNRR